MEGRGDGILSLVIETISIVGFNLSDFCDFFAISRIKIIKIISYQSDVFVDLLLNIY